MNISPARAPTHTTPQAAGELFGEVGATPRRIVCIAPSNTEILYALGAEERIVGVSRYCDYPEAARAAADRRARAAAARVPRGMGTVGAVLPGGRLGRRDAGRRRRRQRLLGPGAALPIAATAAQRRRDRRRRPGRDRDRLVWVQR